MKVALYCRVSTDEQNPKHQEKALKEYCDRMNHDIFKVYTDVYTGTKDSRPAFNEMLEDMRKFKFNSIAVIKLDRIGRSLKHLLSLFDELNNKGVHFIATTQSIDTSTSAGKFQMQVLGAVAEFERNLISERTKEAIKNNPNVGKRGPDKKPRKIRGGLRKSSIY